MEAAVTLERMVHGGRALTRLEDGRVALVAGGIPGERVTAELQNVKGVQMGRVVTVLAASPDRVAPPRHPGLDYGFIRYARQLELKREVVEDALRRVGLAAAVPAVRAAPAEWGYRSAVQPALTGRGLGYRREGSHAVDVLDDDPVANGAVRAAWRIVVERSGALRGVREVAFRGNDDGETLLALVTSLPERALLGVANELVQAGIMGVAHAPFDPRGRFRRGSSRLAGARSIRQRYGDVDLSVTATSFAQPNPAAASALYRELVAWLDPGGHAWDLFAGGGAIAFHLASRYRAVTAVELDRASVARAERDAERLGLDQRVRFLRADARRAPLPSDADVLAADPPRAGLPAALREQILASGAPRLLYVACDPATWARDVAAFEAGGLRLERVQPFDFYPHTHHVELLSLLAR
ncbi:MAG TPA: methyltransferase domain-containing protein [Trueperaceae bacterium]|nr:methyltransferase domain-containing protein [Trueperaceae bacterium]